MDEANIVAARSPPVSATAVGAPTRNHFRNASSPTIHRWRNRRGGEREPLIRRRSLGPPGEENELAQAQPVAGGTVLGIHNLAIVMPQFLVSLLSRLMHDLPLLTNLQIAIISSAIFKIVDSVEDPNDHNTYLGKNGVAWVLRFGGLCTLVSSRNYLHRGVYLMFWKGRCRCCEDGTSHEDGEGDAASAW